MVLIDATVIPIVDLAKLETDFEGVSNEIKEVAATWGFLYVKNTGIQQEQIDRMFEIVSCDSIPRGCQEIYLIQSLIFDFC